LADEDVSASAAKGHSAKFTIEDKISSLNRMLARLQEKVRQTGFHSCYLLALFMNVVLYEGRRRFSLLVMNNDIF
jgi:precorrin-6B methylase 1